MRRVRNRSLTPLRTAFRTTCAYTALYDQLASGRADEHEKVADHMHRCHVTTVVQFERAANALDVGASCNQELTLHA
jgi:hypothetical protein